MCANQANIFTYTAQTASLQDLQLLTCCHSDGRFVTMESPSSECRPNLERSAVVRVGDVIIKPRDVGLEYDARSKLTAIFQHLKSDVHVSFLYTCTCSSI